MDNAKAVAYLSNRLEKLCDEKAVLEKKFNKAQMEMEETAFTIVQMSEDVDKAFDVFSPRAKKNDFAKLEIEKLIKHKEELKKLCGEYSIRCNELNEDISLLEEALDGLNGSDIIEEAAEVEDNNDNDTKDDAGYAEKVNFHVQGEKILYLHEKEKQRYAMILHDKIAQNLANIVHKNEICARVVEVDPIRAKLELMTMSKSIREVIEDVRKIIEDIRPMSLDDLGLDITIERLLTKLDETTPMNLSLLIEGEKTEVSEIVALTILELIRESAINSIIHSRGKNLTVRFKYGLNEHVIEVEDDGIGFDTNGMDNLDEEIANNHFGLKLMSERVSLLSGVLEINSEINKGTKVRAIIPNIK